MKTSLQRGLLVLAGLGCALPSRVSAEAPDVREIRPAVMLLVDTSGSMERLPGGSLPPPPEPVCTGPSGSTNEKNRWTTLLEAMTGTWSNFYCTTQSRNTSAFSGAPDYNYYLAYHEPPLSQAQNTNGILDAYVDRIKFGLMTFDATYTFADTHPLLYPQTAFQGRLADNFTQNGGFSYGEPKPLTYPGCVTTFMVDSGARNSSANGGAMISVGSDSDDHRAINQSIQTQLLNARPFGSTPTAAMLDDFRYYLDNHADVAVDSDPLARCRGHYAILLTDGQPDEDFRDARFNCDAVGGCPYQRAADVAADLCQYDATSEACTGAIDGLFVVALDVSDAAALAELNDIAARGGTVEALTATDREELLESLAQALDQANQGATTRSRPAFVTAGSSFSSSGTTAQLQFNAGFEVGEDGGPWSGILERTRFECDATLSPVRRPLDASDRFHDILNQRNLGSNPRRLLTVVTPDAADMDGNIIGPTADTVPLSGATSVPHVRATALSDFSAGNSDLSPAHFGITSGTTSDQQARRAAIIDWVHGAAGSPRESIRFGDVYHSTPVAVASPRADISDESYNQFRRRDDIATRPTVLYVGTNDGVLHAFAVEDATTSSGDAVTAGTELWGFVPPILMSKLESATSAHQFMVDGPIVVQDVFYQRLPGDNPSADLYHTVLVAGLGTGGRGYLALDVTDPLNPVFLWQFVGLGDPAAARGTPTSMGLSQGAPALGQVLVEMGGTLQERAAVLLPGGAGSLDESAAAAAGSAGCAPQGVGAPSVTAGTSSVRSRQRCWDDRARVLTWVDVATGQILHRIGHDVFNAPLTGGVSLYPGETGTIAERAFVTDADGVLWRVDFGARRPVDWRASPLHDLFWNAGALEGQPALNPPVISTDDEGNLVVIQATGDVDRLDGAAQNRVVSLTESRVFSGGTPTYSGSVNWEIVLQAGEQVTGPVELFEGTVYFGSFKSGSSASNACAVGESRVWAVDYLERGGSPPSGYSTSTSRFPNPRFESTAGSGVFDLFFRGPFSDQIVMGVGLTQRPTCVEGVEDYDPYIGRTFRVTNTGGGAFQLTAQMSGDSTGGPGGSSIAQMTETLPTPEAFSSVQAFAGRADD